MSHNTNSKRKETKAHNMNRIWALLPGPGESGCESTVAGRPRHVCVARRGHFGYTPGVANPFTHWIRAKGPFAPWLFLALFIGASFLMIWRLEALSQRGFQGTVLGTLIMPYCSGLGNLIFAFILGHNGGAGADVMINSLVNNITNMTLILGLPAIFWRMSILPARVKPAHPREKGREQPGEKANELNRLSLLMTLMAVLFFSGAVWAMGRKGQLDFNDGLVLVGLFLFWQCFHVVEVLKHNVREDQSLGWTLPLDLILLGVGAYGISRAQTRWWPGYRISKPASSARRTLAG